MKAANEGPPMKCEYRETLLKATDVSLTLGKNVILRDLNVEIRDIYRPGMITGQVVGLLGPSGGGRAPLPQKEWGVLRPHPG